MPSHLDHQGQPQVPHREREAQGGGRGQAGALSVLPEDLQDAAELAGDNTPPTFNDMPASIICLSKYEVPTSLFTRPYFLTGFLFINLLRTASSHIVPVLS